MGMQGGNAGLIQPQRFVFKTFAGQTVLSGLDTRGFPLNYTPGEGTCWVFRQGAWLLPEDYTATDGATIVLAKAAAADDEYTVFSVGAFNVANAITQATADALYHRRRNRVPDPGLRQSQDLANTVWNLVSGQTIYPSDSMCFAFSRASVGGGSVQHVSSVTPGGAGWRNRYITTAANPNPAASDYTIINVPIEGRDISDLGFGATGGRLVLKRYGFNSSVAGDIALTVRNGIFNRTWTGKVTILPGEVGRDVVKWITFTPDVTGSWDTQNGLGMCLGITLCAGSSYQGVAGWQAGNILSGPGCINFMGAVGMQLDVFEVGAYDVADITNPAPPRFVMKSWADEERDVMRYFRKMVMPAVVDNGGQSGYGFRFHFPIHPRMRIPPTLAGLFGGSNSNVASIGPETTTVDMIGFAGNYGNVGNAQAVLGGGWIMTMNARMI